jgi:hypothetical protein
LNQAPSRGALRAGCALTLTGLAISLAACGGSGNEPANASDSEADRETAQVRLQQCLRKQGVNLPSPGQRGEFRDTPLDRQKMRKAMEGPCKKHREEAFGDFTEEDRQEMRDRMVKFSACMRRNGVDMPDVKAGGGPQRVTIDRDNPRVQKAEKACRKLLPQPPGGPRRGPGGGPQIMMGPGPGPGGK